MSSESMTSSDAVGWTAAEPAGQSLGLLALGGLLGFVALLDLMPAALLAIALVVAARVRRHPEESAVAGCLFLFASGILLPYSARFKGDVAPWEMYYWSAGLLVVTLTGGLSLGWGRVWRAIPRAGQLLFGVALLAALHGLSNGAAPSFVVRQLYGAWLLPVYLGLGAVAGGERLFVQRVARWGSAIGLCFLVYYIAVFPRYGFHKEMGFVGTQGALLAMVLSIAAIEQRRLAWLLGGLVLAAIPMLIFMRKDVLTMVFGMILARGMTLERRSWRMAVYLLCALMVLPSVWPPATQWVNDQLAAKAPALYAIIPDGSKDSNSLLDRGTELLAAVAAVQKQPLLADGLGAEIDWQSLFTSLAYAHYVDSGWGYLLQKFGLLGTAVFLALLVRIMRAVSVRSLGLSTCLMASAFIAFFSEPLFFHFTTAPLLGAMAGILIASRPSLNAAPQPEERQESWTR